MTTAPFRRPTVLALAALSVASFAAFVVVPILVPPIDREAAAGPNGTSRSALGHAAFVELLRQSGYQVLLSAGDSAEKAGSDALLLAAEPELLPGARGERELERLLSGPGAALLVLPKRSGRPSRDEPGHVANVDPVPIEEVDRVLDAAGIEGGAVRSGFGGREPTWTDHGDGSLALSPRLRDPQLLGDAEGAEPLLTCDEGALLARFPPADDRGRELFVLADPDLIANHGLWRDDNARIAVAAVARAAGGRRVVVVDESLHGASARPSLWRALFELPLVLALIQGLLAAAALVGAGIARFGAPVPTKAPLEPGLEYLVRNTAELVRVAGHADAVLGRYLGIARLDVARSLRTGNAPGDAGTDELLRRAEATRGVAPRLDEIEEEVAAAAASGRPDAILAAADRIHRWREEMLHGAGRRSRAG